MRFGRHPTRHDYRTLRFADYAAALPPPPLGFDSLAEAYTALGESNPAQVFPMDGNDIYGDCTIAARAHADTIWNAYGGAKDIPTRAWCLRTYFQLTGGVDSGLDLLTVLRNWRTSADDKILGFVAINPQDHVHIQQALVMFKTVYVGFQCTAGMIAQFDARKPWTPGPLVNDGHCVALTGYTGVNPTDMLNCLTWGNTQQAEWSWWDEVSSAGRGEAYAIVSAADEKWPGFNLRQFLTDLRELTG